MERMPPARRGSARVPKTSERWLGGRTEESPARLGAGELCYQVSSLRDEEGPGGWGWAGGGASAGA
jgi:hypothetical protein